jgi:hypothetical protein
MDNQKLIVIIDDKDHALKQTVFEFPGIRKNDIAFRHFDTLQAFREAKLGRVHVILLDYFLSKDRAYGSSVIPELECEHLVCFSSLKAASDSMCRIALGQGRERIKNVYSVQKLKETFANRDLHEVLEGIFRGDEPHPGDEMRG